MTEYRDDTYDVIVVGAGPTGLLAAGDIAKAGFKVIVLEKHVQIHSFSRAFGLTPRTLEILATRNITQSLMKQGHRFTFNNNAAWSKGLDSFATPYTHPLAIPQPLIDQELENYARDCGAIIMRGTTVTHITAHTAPITVAASDTQGASHTYAARYLIAADGSKSTIRERMGIGFPGKTVLAACALADAVLDPTYINPRFQSSPAVGRTKNLCAFMIPYGYDHKYRVAIWNSAQTDIHAPVTDEELTTALHQCFKEPIPIVCYTSKTRFSSDERLIEHYRSGNVFFTGDAAHCHSPAGGQGLNTGLQDSANLSWKLVCALNGAPDHILDTYHSERHPIGKRAITSSGLLLKANTSRNPLYRYAMALTRFIARYSARAQKFISGSMSGLGLRYTHTNASGNTHPLIGTRAMFTTDTGTILDHLDGITFLLALPLGHAIPSQLPSNCRIVHTPDIAQALLIRPDGYITAVAHESDPNFWCAELAVWQGINTSKTTAKTH